MTSERASAVNKAIWGSLGGKVFKERNTWIIQDIDGTRRIMGEQGNLEFWQASAAKHLAKHYYTDMNAAIAAAGELLNYELHIYLDPDNPHIVYKNGKRDEFGDLWTTLPAQSNAPADIAAAICEAIVTARQMVVESEVTSE